MLDDSWPIFARQDATAAREHEATLLSKDFKRSASEFRGAEKETWLIKVRDRGSDDLLSVDPSTGKGSHIPYGFDYFVYNKKDGENK